MNIVQDTKLKSLGIGKSREEVHVSFNLNSINDFFVNIPVDLSGVIDYITEMDAAPHQEHEHLFSFSPVTECDVR